MLEYFPTARTSTSISPKSMWGCSMWHLIKYSQIKTAVRCGYTPLECQNSEPRWHQVLWRVWSSRDSLITHGSMKLWKTVWHFLEKFLCGPAIKFLVIYPRRVRIDAHIKTCKDVCRSFIYEWQNLEANKMAFLLQVKPTVLCPSNEMLFTNQKIDYGTHEGTLCVAVHCRILTIW